MHRNTLSLVSHITQRRANTTRKQNQTTVGCFNVQCSYQQKNLSKFKQHVQRQHQYYLAKTPNNQTKYINDKDSKVLCILCRLQFVNNDQYQEHRPKAWRIHKQINASKQQQIQMLQLNFVPQQSKQKRISHIQQLSNRMLRPYIERYLEINNLDLVNIQGDFIVRLDTFGKQLASARVNILKWQDLSCGGTKYQWKKFISFPGQVFDTMMNSKAALWKQQQRMIYAKMVKKLIKKDARFKGIFIPQYKVQKKANIKEKLNISYQSFLIMVQSLLRQKSVKLNHLAITLLFLAIVGIRSTDYNIVKDIFNQCNTARVYKYKQSKTNNYAYAPLTQQFIKLANFVGWKQISSYQQSTILPRVSKWMGVSVYALRRMAFLSRHICLKNNEDSIKRFSGHKTDSAIQSYVQSATQAQLQRMIPTLSKIYNIPKLPGSVSDDFYREDIELLKINRYHLPKFWFNSFTKLYKLSIQPFIFQSKSLPYLELSNISFDDEKQDQNQSSQSEQVLQQQNQKKKIEENTKPKAIIQSFIDQIAFSNSIIPIQQLQMNIQQSIPHQIPQQSSKIKQMQFKKQIKQRKYDRKIKNIEDQQFRKIGLPHNQTFDLAPLKINQVIFEKSYVLTIKQQVQYETLVEGGPNHTVFAFTPDVGFSVLPFTLHYKQRIYNCAFCTRKLFKYLNESQIYDDFCLCWMYVYLPTPFESIIYTGKPSGQKKIEQPRQYFWKQMPMNQLILKIFLVWRGFRYIKTAHCNQNGTKQFKFNANQFLKSPIAWNKAHNQYFPPISLVAIPKMMSQHGQQVGIIATQQIQENVLIGEYASQLIQKQSGFLIRRLDSVFQIGNYLLAPINRCGYVPLINQPMQNQQANCIAVSLIYDVNRPPGIFIVTKRRISPKQELLYQYGAHFERKEKTV